MRGEKMYLRILHPLLFIIAASALLVFSILSKEVSWIGLSVTVLLYTKGTQGVLVYFQMKSASPSRDAFKSKYLHLVAIGYSLTAVLALVSWLRGEGLSGLLLAIATTVATIVWFFVARRSESVAD